MRWLAVIICLAIVTGGCGSRPDDRTEDGRVIVDYWEKWTGFEAEAMQAIVDDFNASQDRIYVRMLPVSQIDQKLLLATAGGNPPDVAGLWSHTVNVFAEKNALMPLDALAAEAGIDASHYIPIFWKLCRYRGFLWALPSTPATLGLHWNKAMFRKAGLDPDRPPRTIAELEAFSEKLTIVEIERGGQTVQLPWTQLTDAEKRAKDFDLVQVGHLPSEPGWFKEMWGFWFGARLLSEDGRTVLADSPENIAAFEWYRSAAERFGPRNIQRFGSGFGNPASPQNPFLSGKVAMVLQGVWMHNFIEKFSPGLEWGAAAFPSVNAETLPNVTIAECDVLVIPRGARHRREAFEFIRYVNQQKPMEKLCLGQKKFSPLAECSPTFADRHPNPYIEVFIELAHSPNARHVPQVSIWNEYKAELIVAVDAIAQLTVSPQAALQAVVHRMQRKLDRVNRRWDKVGSTRLQEWRDRNAP